MANADKGAAILDMAARKFADVIDGSGIDWEQYLRHDDAAKIVPAEALAERCRRELLLGREAESGLTLPWPKTRGRVLIRPGKLALWAGWSRHGKTQMLKQLMCHAIRDGEKVLIASMEEEIHEVWKDMARIACATDEFTKSNTENFVRFVTGNLWLYDQQGTVDARRIQALIRYAVKQHGVTQVVVDSLMMLAVSRDDYDAQRRFVAELKTTAKDTGVAVHLVAHMRKGEGRNSEDSPGSLHDISGGHEIGSIADYVFVVWRDQKGSSEVPAILKVDKQRGQVNWTGKVGLNIHQVSRQFVEDVHATQYLTREPGEDFEEDAA